MIGHPAEEPPRSAPFMKTLPLSVIACLLSCLPAWAQQTTPDATSTAPDAPVVVVEDTAPIPAVPPPKPASPVAPDAVPAPLKPWVDWVLRDLPYLDCPPAHDAPQTRLCLWPSRLKFDATATGAAFALEVRLFSRAWLHLPGSPAHWPLEITSNGQPVPVLERDGRPAIHLEAGDWSIAGRFTWSELPQQIKLPPEVGLLALSVNGTAQGSPTWDGDGTLWLQRQASSEPVDEDFLSLKMHSLLEDGIPLWFETRLDLIVAGKSREETLGSVLPAGWQLAAVDSPLPVAIDERGLLKAQLRAGRWTIGLRAFRTGSATQIAFAEGATPPAPEQVLAFRGQPAFRQAEIVGLPQIDVAQTQVPEDWRSLPVYRWETTGGFELTERVRGPGERGQSPLTIQRSLWLDEDGKALTFQDRLTGPLREIRRLDVAAGHQLGSVTAGGVPQLITHNPENDAPGFEVRQPQLEATATGRVTLSGPLPATGWQADADQLNATLHLAPGYRMLALLGVDRSKGDWLRAWTLLDLFLLLLFTLAVFRLRGFLGAVLACVAFGLAYHEPGAPRFSWLLLLVPVALEGAIPEGTWRKVTTAAKWTAAVILLLTLTPFASRQIQAAIFPQLEPFRDGGGYYAPMADAVGRSMDALESAATMPSSVSEEKLQRRKQFYDADNLKADPKAVIQTGPGVPTWAWRRIEFGWDGPVTASQEVTPILIPPTLSRVLYVARVLCLVGLAALLLRRRPGRRIADKPEPTEPSSGNPLPAAAAIILGFLLAAAPTTARAQFPDQALLDELRERLTRPTDAFPGAVSLEAAALTLDEQTFTLDLTLHAAARSAAPTPVALGIMAPGEATLDGAPATVLRREGALWVLLPDAGIHHLKIAGRIRAETDWEWGFGALKPRRLTVAATGWTVSGLRPDGGAEDQVLFAKARRQEEVSAAADYDRPDTKHALLVDREIELGLVWRVRTTVRRLSPTGRSTALRVPLLPGEKVVSAGNTVEGGAIEVRLAPDANEAAWEGELAPVNELTLSARESDTWTEQWRLLASSVWNVTFAGLNPTFEDLDGQLVPLWQPWPGESATLTVSRPQAVPGAAVTIDSATHTLNPGRRQRTASLNLSLRTSLGEDFPIRLPAGAEIVTLTHDDQSIPVRKDGDAVVVPLRPGAQRVSVEWRLPSDEGKWTVADAITLPVEAANVSTIIQPPGDRWPLFSQGPQRGPAFRFWGVLAFVLIVATVLSRVPASPLPLVSWLLLSIGLTQVPIALSLIVVGWLFLMHWRGSPGYQRLSATAYNLLQVMLIGLTVIVIGIFIGVASAGLLGNPEMYISGNGSSSTHLNWYADRSPAELPRPGYWSLSIWWYRFAMLLWALWLAAALVKWLRTAWRNSSNGGHFRQPPRKASPPSPPRSEGKATATPPALPGTAKPELPADPA